MSISLKLGKMRKAEDFVIYPSPFPTPIPEENGYSSSELLKLQSDHRCIVIYIDKKKAVIGKYNRNYPTFFDCRGYEVEQGTAYVIDVDDALIKQIKAKQPKHGDVLSSGVCRIA